MSVRRLEGPDELDDAHHAFERLFTKPGDEAGAPPVFGPNAIARDVLQPIEMDLSQEMREALCEASGLDILPALISTTGRWEDVPWATESALIRGRTIKRGHWFVSDLCDPHLYGQLDRLGWNHIEECAIYDPAGKWGMLVAFEGFAVVAGEPNFLRGLRVASPPGTAWGIEALRSAQEGGYREFERDEMNFTWIARLEAALES